MPRPPRVPLLVAMLCAALVLAGCGGGGDESETTAEATPPAGSDALVVYSGRNEKLIGPLLEEYTMSTGNAVTARYGGSAELAAQLLEEGDRTPASVFLSQDAGALGALQAAGRLEQLDPALLDRVPEAFRSGEGQWVGVSGRARVLIYNTDQVQEADLPDSVLDLTGPAYRDQVAVAPGNASFQAFVTGLRVSAGEDRAKQFLTALKANGAKTYEGNSQIVAAVNSGEIAYGLVNHYYLYELAAELGGLDELTAANHYFGPKDPGGLVNVAGVGVPKGNADDRSAAFLDYLLGREAQTYFAEKTYEYPLVAGVPAEAEGAPPLAEITAPDVDLSDLASLEQTLALLDEVGLT